MKKIIYLVVFLLCYCAYGQSLSVFDIDTSAFPKIRAKFYAFDASGKQITNLSPADFEIKENGTTRTVTNVSCPSPKPPQALSSVLTIDVSGSMRGNGISIAKEAATAWINAQANALDECAITSFNEKNYINQDFTTNKNKLLIALNNLRTQGQTNYETGLIKPPAGSLEITKNAKYKKLVIFLSDGQPNYDPQIDQIISEANRQNCVIYSVVLEMDCPKCLKDISNQTGGKWFENVTTAEQAKNIYLQIQNIAQGGDPCTIEWQSEVSCQAGMIDVELRHTSLNLTSNASYFPSDISIARLEFSPNFMILKNIIPGVKKDTTVTVTARNSNFNIANIKSSNPVFTINPVNFSLVNGQSTDLTLSYNSVDSTYKYTKFSFESDQCQPYYYAGGGYQVIKPKVPTLTLINPNGGEEYVVGSDSLIIWTGVSEIDTVQLEYSIDDGMNWILITTKASDLKYVWKNIPKPASDRCKVKVRHVIGNLTNGIPGTLRYSLEGHTLGVHNVSWSPDGNRVATSADYTAKIWNAYTGKLLLTLIGHTSYVNHVSWSPDGSRVATVSNDSTAKIWDVATGAILKTLKGHTGYVHDICWSPDGSSIATVSSDKTAKIWNANTGSLIHTLTGHSWYINNISWSPDGTRVLTSSADKTAIIWNVSTGTKNLILSGHQGSINKAAWSPDGSMVATVSYDNTAFIWNANNGTILRTLSGHTSNINDVSWKGDGSKLVTGSNDNTAIIWNVSSGTKLFTLNGHTGSVNNVNWSPDGTKIATASSDFRSIIWDSRTGANIFTLIGHINWVNNVTWNPEGTCVATASEDNTANIWFIENQFSQEDMSDQAFRIIAPKASAFDIDMKQCLIGSTKDSVVVGFLKNNGTFKYRVDSIYFTGADASAFSLVSGFPKYEIASGGSRFAEFRFQPFKDGMHQAEIVIITQADTLIQNILGAGTQPRVEVLTDIIDFGIVDKGKSRDTLQVVTIKNISATPLMISSTNHNIPNDIDFTTIGGFAPFTLNAGDTAKMDLRFKPSDVGRTSGTLEFHYNGVGSPAVVQLFGEGVNRSPKILTNISTIPDLICDNMSSSTFLISNSGGNPLIISTVDISGTDKNDFKLLEIAPIIIEADSSKILNIQFSSSIPGIKTANIEIKSNADPDSLLVIPLTAKKDSANIEPDLQTIDFGNFFVNQSADTSIILKNWGTIDNKVIIAQPASFTLNSNAITLTPDATSVLNIYFPGSVSAKAFDEFITITDTICSRTYQVHLLLKVNNPATAILQAGSLEAYPGDVVEVPVILNNQENIQLSGATSLKTDLSYNSTLLYPLDFTQQKVDDTTAKITLLDLPINTTIGEPLAKVKFKVGLGSTEECDLTLSNGEAVGGLADITLLNGHFRLLGICREGGARLINRNSQAGMLKVAPNPTDGTITVEFSITEKSNTELSIYNILGEKVKTIFSENVSEFNKRIIHYDVQDLSSGQYMILFRTPTYNESLQLMILK
ncbi:MAG: choice-of-anchor D domain-containing protein [Bacteroidota bacterium]